MRRIFEAVQVGDRLSERMAEKADRLRDVPRMELDAEEAAFVRRLPRAQVKDLWEEDDLKNLQLQFDQDPPRAWFVLEMPRATLLVNTEGYRYCRYLGRLGANT
jgi:hypothetical protein